MGGSGIIFNITCYIKNQYNEDKVIGLILIDSIMIFILLMSIFVLKPIILSKIDWSFIDKIHKRECEDNNENTPVKDNVSKIIQISIDDMINRKRKHIDNDDKILTIFKDLNK